MACVHLQCLRPDNVLINIQWVTYEYLLGKYSSLYLWCSVLFHRPSRWIYSEYLFRFFCQLLSNISVCRQTIKIRPWYRLAFVGNVLSPSTSLHRRRIWIIIPFYMRHLSMWTKSHRHIFLPFRWDDMRTHMTDSLWEWEFRTSCKDQSNGKWPSSKNGSNNNNAM